MPYPSKFQVGDKVVLNGKCPQWIYAELRHNRERTIVRVGYSPTQKHALYFLGTNRKGFEIEFYGFRAEMLRKPIRRKVGRPIKKRVYNRLSMSPPIGTALKPSNSALTASPCIYRLN